MDALPRDVLESFPKSGTRTGPEEFRREEGLEGGKQGAVAQGKINHQAVELLMKLASTLLLLLDLATVQLQL
jgi:hypothetical protein